MNERLARTHIDAPKVERHALTGERRSQQVMIADGGAAKRHEHIRMFLAREGESLFEFGNFVAENTEIDRFAARLFDDGGDRIVVARDDLRGTGNGSGRNKFVARREDCDAWLSHDG